MKRTYFYTLFIALLLLIAFTGLAQEVTQNNLIYFDQTITTYIFSFYSAQLTLIMKIFTETGSTEIIVTNALILQYFLLTKLKDYWKGLFSLLALIGAWGLNDLLKEFFQRVRPEAHRLIDITGYSFPSGHSMVSMAFYGMIAYLFFINSKRIFFKVVIPALLLLLVIFIGISRVYLGVHYPSDVIGGFVAGAAWLILCVFGLNAVKYYKSKNPSRV